MLFNSIDFAVFLPIVFLLYWFVCNKDIRHQNFLIVVSSYTFYGWWNWKFLSLIIFSTIVDYSIGLALRTEQKEQKRRLLLWASVIVNLGILGFFKYCNFFIENFTAAFSFFGHHIEASSLNLILPVGISFYTFQTLSYTIDVYRKRLEPTTDFISFSAFVSFFPQLVAGPIERASNLVPQFNQERTFNYGNAVDGLRQILWGLFKKVVIADNCAQFVNIIFQNPELHTGSALLIGAVLFSFQIYGDFSGYSDIAIGTARLFGFNLKKNFAFPYFSRDIAEFWRRWHISLSTWFRDYLYIPLGGSRGSLPFKIRNVFIIFVVSGFWHGASWNFIVWGMLNAVFFLPLLVFKRNRSNLDVVAAGRRLPSFTELHQIIATFGLTTIAWIFFRAESIRDALLYLERMFSASLFAIPNFNKKTDFLILSFLLVFFIVLEWKGRAKEYAIEHFGVNANKTLVWGFYLILCQLIFLFQGEQQQFIYFQF